MISKKKITATTKLVKKYVKVTEFIQTTITDPEGRVMEMLLHPDKLVLVSSDFERLYIMDSWKPWDHSKVPGDRMLMLDYLFTVEEIIVLKKEPERFVKILTTAPVGHPSMYYIYIDGQLVHRTLSSRVWTKVRNAYLRERKLGGIKFNHLKTVDPAQHVTNFVFDQKDPGVEATRALLRKRKSLEI